MEKKTFIFLIVVLGLVLSCSGSGKKAGESDRAQQNKESKMIALQNESDGFKLGDVYNYADSVHLSDSLLSSVISNVALQFIGTPYVAKTLEQEGEEHLVINLRQFDCTTLVENVLAISYCVKAGELHSECFIKRLREIRYRKGVIDQYPSRLHYFSEWLADNQAMGFLEIVSNDFGDMYFNTHVNFMSSNATKYKQLSEFPSYVEVMKSVEKRISGYDLKCVSEDQIEEKAKFIKDGDVIAFCSTIEGLDVAHTALAFHLNNQLHFIHASTTKDKVVISEKSLDEYVKDRKNVYGILVARPVVKN